MAANCQILIHTGERPVGRICGITLIGVTKLLLDVVKPF